MKGEKKFDIKKKLSKILNLKVFLVIAVLVVLFSVYQLLTRDKFVFSFETLSSYTVNDSIDLNVTVFRGNDMVTKKYYENDGQTLSDKLFDKLKSDKVSLKMALYDADGKKVKGTNEKVKAILKESNDVEIELPENLEPGIYTLKTKARKGLLFDKVETELNLSEASTDLITISMDKGIYKPGDEVKFRALITNNRDNKPIIEDVTVSIYDGNNNRVYFEEAKTSEFGIISGVFKIGDEVNSGIYRLAVNIGTKEKEQSFKVESYTEERFKLEITNTKDVFAVNEYIEFDINANYFFGEPVVDATIEIIDENERKGDSVRKVKTDSSGHATFKTKKTEAGNYNFTIKAVDASNYYVEKNHMVAVSNSSFNIDIVPEFGDIISGVKNRIFVYVNDHQNNPVEAICSLEVKNIAREFSTDENGIGFVDLSSSDIASLLREKNNKKIYVRVQNEAGEIVDYSEQYNILKVNNVLSTDSVIYNQGDEIEITLGNYSEKEEKIYVVKKGELIKTLDVSNENVTFTLEDTFGLIDFYITGTTENRENRLNKRTVFIKPKEGMKLSISKDSEEYKPSDNMTLSITNSSDEDAAYLVSIIDTANLNIADNDLNIDKIKLALEDVKFTDGVDAATVYASIMAGTSEIELEKLLVKQSSSDFSINSKKIYPDIDLDIYSAIIGITIIIVMALFTIIFAYYNITGKEGNKLFNFVSRTLVINVLTMFLLMSFIDEFIGMEVILELILSIILAIVLYIKVLVKYEKYISKVIYELVSTILMGYGVIGLIYVFSEFIGGPLSVVLLVIIILLMYKKRNSLFVKVVLRLLGIAIKNLVVIYASMIIVSILDIILNFSYRYLDALNVIAVIVAYALLYKYEKGKKNYQNKKTKKTDVNGNVETTKHKDIFYYIGVGFVGFCVISVIASSSIVRNFSNSINDEIYSSGDVYMPSGSVSSSKGDAFIDTSQFGAYSDNASSESSLSQIIPDLDFSFDMGITNSADSIITEDMQESSVVEDVLLNQGVTEEEKVHIRNVFLESLAFLPEVVAEKGNIDLDIKLSDNITTWKVQVVGNTKTGDIAYTNTEFKVFKDFFVDFTVPNNLKVGDVISIPATVYNYTENAMNVNLKVNEDSWFRTDNMNYSVNVDAKGQALVYIKLEILKQGKENKLRIEASSNNLKDIIEKNVPVEFNGIELADVSASGNTAEDISGEVIFKDEFIENSNSVTVNIYPNLMAFAVEGMDSILQMPNGCFEQVSSSLYPDIMVLSYLENVSQDDESKDLKEKAIEYVNKGYQKILTYEVKGESGGFSLYGDPKAETVLTAYGLMELNDLSKVYPVDEKVLERMEKFLSKKQKNDGSFELTGGTTSNLDSKNDYANNAYILWALSEYNPKSEMLKKGVDYLKDNMDNIKDTYTLALIANVLVNVEDSAADKCIDNLIDKLNTNTYSNSNIKYLECDCVDYMGTRNSRMNIQATALLSMALSKDNKKQTLNQELIDYIISQRGRRSWGTTQTTVLALRAINEYNKISKSTDQKIKVTVGDETKEVEIKKSGVTFVRLDFNNLNNDKTVTYEIKGIKSNIYYEVVKNYFVEYDKYQGLDDLKVVSAFERNEYNVNDVINQKISINNNIGNSIKNIMVEVQIPQGCTLIKDTLEKAVTMGNIEKYEFNYGKVYIYLRDLGKNKTELIDLEYRALYPVDIQGGAVRVYDYYNPETVEYIKPERIIVY